MDKKTNQGILEQSRIQFREIIAQKGLTNNPITIQAKILTPQEAIGNPRRRDYPIIEGRERMLEANFSGSRGHAFTDTPDDFKGFIEDVLALSLDRNSHRAIYLSTLNAVAKHLSMVNGTVHCKNNDPEKCARHIADHIQNTWGNIRLGLIGLNPAMAEQMAATFGSKNLIITDMDKKNIGVKKFGVTVWDGRTRTSELVETADVVLATGTTLGNGTFDKIWHLIKQYRKPYLFYGVTIAGISQFMGIDRICPYGADQ